MTICEICGSLTYKSKICVKCYLDTGDEKEESITKSRRRNKLKERIKYLEERVEELEDASRVQYSTIRYLEKENKSLILNMEYILKKKDKETILKEWHDYIHDDGWPII